MAGVELVRVLRGAVPFCIGNVNDTYRGMVLCRDGTQRHGVIKDLNVQQLVNELLATVLGRELGLPVPEGYLGFVPKGELGVNKVELNDGSGHLVFVSGDVGTPNLAQQITNHGQFVETILIHLLRKWQKLGDLYAFDAWIANTDRHRGNILIDGPNSIWLIDHGHAFTGPTWLPNDLDPATEYRHRLQEWMTDNLTATEKNDRGKEAGIFATRIAAMGVAKAVEESKAEFLLSPQAANAVVDFLMRRVQHVPSEAKRALGVPVLVS
ncbi:HipA family kinase [Cereibacter sphaeroides]|uniref:HipA family kinase n=1 Tax=Cereibacter sphaeroides TaxID=1063 RepID=UPI00313C71A5